MSTSLLPLNLLLLLLLLLLRLSDLFLFQKFQSRHATSLRATSSITETVTRKNYETLATRSESTVSVSQSVSLPSTSSSVSACASAVS